MSEDGFAAIAKQLTAMNVTEAVTKKGLTDAAQSFVDKLEPVLPSAPNAPLVAEYGTLNDKLTTIDKDDHVQVSFQTAFWWLFLEHGTVQGIRPYNFVHNTFETNREQLKQLMAKPVMDALKK